MFEKSDNDDGTPCCVIIVSDIFSPLYDNQRINKNTNHGILKNCFSNAMKTYKPGSKSVSSKEIADRGMVQFLLPFWCESCHNITLLYSKGGRKNEDIWDACYLGLD